MDILTQKKVRKRWLSVLFELAHAGYQERLWIAATVPNTSGGYTACVGTYFDDLNLENGYVHFISEGVISISEFLIVVQLHAALCNYTAATHTKTYTNKEVLQDPEWIALTQMGFTAWEALKQKVSKTELAWMHMLEAKL